MYCCSLRWRFPSHRAQRCRSALCVSDAVSHSSWTPPLMSSTASQSMSLQVCIEKLWWDQDSFSVIYWPMCPTPLLSTVSHSDAEQTDWELWRGDSSRGGCTGPDTCLCILPSKNVNSTGENAKSWWVPKIRTTVMGTLCKMHISERSN